VFILFVTGFGLLGSDCSVLGRSSRGSVGQTARASRPRLSGQSGLVCFRQVSVRNTEVLCSSVTVHCNNCSVVISCGTPLNWTWLGLIAFLSSFPYSCIFESSWYFYFEDRPETRSSYTSIDSQRATWNYRIFSNVIRTLFTISEG
jgi:hypothetical protein